MRQRRGRGAIESQTHSEKWRIGIAPGDLPGSTGGTRFGGGFYTWTSIIEQDDEHGSRAPMDRLTHHPG